jgi:hypothetical protein
MAKIGKVPRVANDPNFDRDPDVARQPACSVGDTLKREDLIWLPR